MTARDHNRLASLDGLRGIAVMGIAAMNILAFAYPAAAYLNPRAWGGTAPADLATWALLTILVDGKFRALFSMLFGASMLIVVARAEAAGRDGAVRHVARMATLFAIGFAHAMLLWPGDILMLYAMVGLVALAFAGKPPRALLVAALALLVAQAAIDGAMLRGTVALRDAAAAPAAPPATREAWAAAVDSIGPMRPAAARAEVAAMRRSWPALVRDRLANGLAEPLGQLETAGLETLGLMLIGMAGLKSGFLAGRWPRRRYAGIALAAYAIGLTIAGWLAWRSLASGFAPIATYADATLYSAPLRPLIAIGHAALLLALVRVPPRIATVGRMALSNYLGTSLVFGLLFYGYGLGLAGRPSRSALMLILPPLWLAMLAWSPWWLARFRHGPVEWLWRSLTLGQRVPFRRNSSIET